MNTITIRSFVQRYDLPPVIVYEASYWLGDRKDFTDEELIDVLKERIAKKKRYHQGRIDKLDEILNKLEKKEDA